MRKFVLLLLFLSLGFLSGAKEKRDLLTGANTPQQVSELLVQNQSWVPFPAYRDRDGWAVISGSQREAYVKAAEKYLGYVWPQVKATEYLEFSRTGNRIAQENPQTARMNALRCLALAELVDGQGRFMDDLINGVFSFCEQTYWGLSACFYMHNRGKTEWNSLLGETNLPDIEDPIIDLWVGDVAADLSWIWYFFHEEFDKVSPVISQRLRSELQKRVLEPYYARNDYWWITGWGRGEANNWSVWCSYNMLTSILLMETDPLKRAQGVYKSMKTVDLFFNAYPEDGGCEEGPSYWNAAGAKAYEYLEMLNCATQGRMNIFADELVKNIGRYIYRVYIGDGRYFINFADAAAKLTPRAALIYRYAERIGDPQMQSFGVWLLNRYGFGEGAVVGTVGPVLDDLFMDKDWKGRPGAEPLVGEHYFPGLQVAVARCKPGTNDGFYFAAKGGNNGETHNHNDVGSGIVFYNGNPVFVDAGVGTYTKETFEAGRYKIWTMRSDYHNLPVINGEVQKPGGRYAARGAQFDSGASFASFSVDIAGAYPEEAAVREWVRSYRLDRTKDRMTVRDRFTLDGIKEKTEIRFLTPLVCHTEKPGTVELEGEGFVISLKYDPRRATPRVETKTIDDPKIVRVWGDRIYVLSFTLAAEKTGDISVELSGKKL